MAPVKSCVLAAIRFYQRHLSPLKGFGCAYRVHMHRASCSAFGARAISRFGVLGGFVLIRQRTLLCGAVHRHHHGVPRHLHGQRGACDVGGCDLPGCDLGPDHACDCCGCDLPTGSGSRGRGSDYVPREKLAQPPMRIRSRVEPGKPRE